MKKINNKGYMLVEIILASVLAMVVAYFIIDLTIKLKNKNDDLLVKTLVATDQAIIYNTIMRDVYENGIGSFSCDKIVIEDNKFIYNGETISLVSEYADIEYDSSNTDYCNIVDGNLELKIPLNVKQLPEDDFDINVNSGDLIENNTTLSCELELTSDNVIKLTDDFLFSGKIIYQGFDSNYEGESVTSKTISDTGTYTYYIKAKSISGEVTASCGIGVAEKVEKKYCVDGSYSWNGYNCSKTTACSVNKKAIYTCSSSEISYASYSTCSGKCSGTCSETIKYSCADSSCSLSGSTCSKTNYGKVGTRITCPYGYPNEANDSYCWKMVE